jgi:hypothetical protein
MVLCFAAMDAPSTSSSPRTTPWLSGSVIQSRAGTTDIKVTSILHRFWALHTQEFACTNKCITGSWRGTSPGQAHGTHPRKKKKHPFQFNLFCSPHPSTAQGQRKCMGQLKHNSTAFADATENSMHPHTIES